MAVNGHVQVWAKVNAPVDRGVRSLVEALSAFPALETLESCEGGKQAPAWICFRYGAYWEHPWRELANFTLGFLAPGLVANVADDVNVRIQVTAGGLIMGELSVRPGAIPRVATVLDQLARHFTAGTDAFA